MSWNVAGPIRDFVLGIYDGPHATPKEATEGPIFLGIKNVTPDGRLDFSHIRHVSEEDFPKWTKRVTPQKDDIVFSYEATLHRYAIIPEGFIGCLGRRLALVRPDKTKVNPRFFHYYFLSPLWRAHIESNIISGATVDRIPLTRFPDFQISIPELEIQDRIASILSAYDDLIENNRRRIQLLEQSARLLYKEWFVHLRFPGHEHVRIIDSVPEGWEKTKLGAKVVLNYGKALKADDRVEGPYPVYGSSGVIGSHEKPLMKGPGIILGRKGNVGTVFWSEKDYCPIDTVYYVDADTSSYYLYHALQEMQFVSSDAAVPGLNRDFAYSRPYLLASDKLLRPFEETLTTTYKQVSQLEEYNDKLKEARDLLLPRLMNGDIPV